MLPNHPHQLSTASFPPFSSTETTTLLLDFTSHCSSCTCTNYINFLRLVICACTIQYVPTYLPTYRTCTGTGTLRTYRTIQYCTYLPFAYPSFFLLHKLRFWNSNNHTLKQKSPTYPMNIPNNIHMLHFPHRHQNRTTRSTPSWTACPLTRQTSHHLIQYSIYNGIV